MEEIRLPVHEALRADVLVVGGGVAGCAAAIAAAPHAAKVFLADKNGVLGGSATLWLVSPAGSIRSASGIRFGGLCDEIFDDTIALAKRYASADNDAISSPDILKYVLVDKATSAGVKLLLHSRLISAEAWDNVIRCAAFATASGVDLVYADAYVDASGDAVLTRMSGAESTMGIEPEACRQLEALGLSTVHEEEAGTQAQAYQSKPGNRVQPVSSMFVLGGVEAVRGEGYINKLLTYEDLGIDEDLFKQKFYYDTPGFEDNGRLVPLPQGRVLFFRSNRQGEVVVNMSRVIGIDATDRDQRTYAEIWTQKQVIGITDFLRSYVPGFERCYLIQSSWMVGIRESVRMVGRTMLSAADVIECKKFKDAIACGYYSIDIHDPQGKRKAIGGCIHGDYYTIPYGSLVSTNIQNLAGAGRILSADHVAHSATRIQGSCILTGQACGTAAAMCVKRGIAYADLEAGALRDTLTAQGVFLPTEGAD